MKTYQDFFERVGEEKRKRDFLLEAINDSKTDAFYQFAETAEEYYKGLNPTIMKYDKYIHDIMGRKIKDTYSANHKIACHLYPYLINQGTAFSLGNGVSFGDEKTKGTLGKNFDETVAEIAVRAQNGGVGYGFWNYDHLECLGFSGANGNSRFVPLFDEETGKLRAGIKYWQFSKNKPLRVTLFEEDGITEYIKREEDAELKEYNAKRPYKIATLTSATGTEIESRGNYEINGELVLPIFPLWNINNQSSLMGNKDLIDAIDLMISAFINNVDDGAIIYWVLKNGGSTEEELQNMLQRLKVNKAYAPQGDEADVQMLSPEVKFEASEASIERLRSQIFDNFMGLDVKNIANGAVTATQITASYEPLNQKADLFESRVTIFINQILDLLGIEDAPTYTRSMIVNQQEMINTIASATNDLSQEYRTGKILEILGDIDKKQEVLDQLHAEQLGLFEEVE